MENHGGMMSTEEKLQICHQSSLAILPAEASGSKQEERANGMMEVFHAKYFCSYLQAIFTCCKIL
jgi:hypothetical protein